MAEKDFYRVKVEERGGGRSLALHVYRGGVEVEAVDFELSPLGARSLLDEVRWVEWKSGPRRREGQSGSPVPAGHEPRLRDLELGDIPGLEWFAPEEWHLALDAVLLQHFGRRYFQGRTAADAGGVVAVGQGIVTGDTGWVGNIIVRPEARRRGLGTRLTVDLVARLRAAGCRTLLLVATDAGEPVYLKLGFRRTGEYVFLRVPRLAPPSTGSLGRLQPSQTDELLRLDRLATGESRAELLGPHLGAGWGHVDASGALDGYFLPSLGAGQVVASCPRAGLELLAFKHAFFPQDAAVPAANGAALTFLTGHGAQEKSRLPRMALGEDPWRPEWIFARGSGYCG